MMKFVSDMNLMSSQLQSNADTIKTSQEVTSIKQSSVLKGHLFSVLS